MTETTAAAAVTAPISAFFSPSQVRMSVSETVDVASSSSLS